MDLATEMMTFGGQAFAFDKAEHVWTLTLKRSDVATQRLEELSLLKMEHPSFLKQAVVWDDDLVTFAYEIEDMALAVDKFDDLVLSEKVRLALNVTDLEACLKLPFNFFIHPENIFFTKDGLPKVAYRGLPHVMPPKTMTHSDFLRQIKCLILHIFTGMDFSDLYGGTLEVATVPEFLKAIIAAEDLSAIRKELETAYKENIAQEAATLTSVSKKRFKLFKYMAIWFSALSLLLLVPLIYILFAQMPFQQKLLDADRDFLKVDYSAVISSLKSVAVHRLPYTQKYELAYAYIQSLDFSKEQRQVILNNVSLKSDELYLDYWIYIGRADHDQALDIAKRLEDLDLILYALNVKIEAVRNDQALSGQERQSQLDSLQKEYGTYNEVKTSVLSGENTEPAEGGEATVDPNVPSEPAPSSEPASSDAG